MLLRGSSVDGGVEIPLTLTRRSFRVFDLFVWNGIIVIGGLLSR